VYCRNVLLYDVLKRCVIFSIHACLQMAVVKTYCSALSYALVMLFFSYVGMRVFVFFFCTLFVFVPVVVEVM
jgi:hypothetical protein